MTEPVSASDIDRLIAAVDHLRRDVAVTRWFGAALAVVLVFLGFVVVDNRTNAARLESTVDGALCPIYSLLLASPATQQQVGAMSAEQRAQYEAYERVLADGRTALGCH